MFYNSEINHLTNKYVIFLKKQRIACIILLFLKCNSSMIKYKVMKKFTFGANDIHYIYLRSTVFLSFIIF